MTLRQRQPRMKDPTYLKSFDGEACIACGARDGTVVGAHIRFQSGSGMGAKPDDSLVLPLCYRCHVTQHEVGEFEFWKDTTRLNSWLLMDAIKALARERYRKWKDS